MQGDEHEKALATLRYLHSPSFEGDEWTAEQVQNRGRLPSFPGDERLHEV